MANENTPTKTTFKVDTLEDALTLLKEHELQHTLRFATFYGREDFGSTGKHMHIFCKRNSFEETNGMAKQSQTL